VAAGWHNIFMNEFRFFMLMLDILPEWITAKQPRWSIGYAPSLGNLISEIY